MKKLSVAILAVAFAVMLAALVLQETAVMAQTEQSVVRHVVLFKFKEAAKPEQVKSVEQAFAALPGKIKQIKALEWGTNISPENLAQGFTHCFLVTFANETDRDAYIVHPSHKEFAASLGPVLDKVLVVDYKAPAK